MRERKPRRLLSLLLAAVMLLSLLPTTALAAGNRGKSGKNASEQAEESYGISAAAEYADVALNSYDGDFLRIVHLDAGRKYFTVGWVESLIDEMAKDGYTHLELAFGNDGLRFLLDDMSVGEYSSDDVTAGIQKGNEAYCDFGTNEWTESEMDEIIAYANNAGIEIIPLLNTPGHMDAIIDAMEYVGIANAAYSSSDRTVDLENTEAVEFTQALVQKYINYFAKKGCTFFHLGADEYANDIDGNPQFAQLIKAGLYDDYVTYLNTLAGMVAEANMTPMAFNDGIYYNNNTSYEIRSDILVTYWSSGWNGYDVASASTLAGKGFQLINTHGDYYYVVGKSDNWDTTGVAYADGWSNTDFSGSTVSNPVGGMFCIWCDHPNAESEETIAENVIDSGILSAMAVAMGAEPVEDPEPVVPEDETVTDDVYDITVTAPGLSEVTVTESTTTVASLEGKKYVVYNIELTDENGDEYTGEATVTIPVPEDWTNVRGGVLESASGGEVLDITGTLKDGTFTFTAPHFSDIVVYATEVEVTNEREGYVPVGSSIMVTIEGDNYADAVDYSEWDTEVATVEVNGTDGTEGSVKMDTVSGLTWGSLISSNGTYQETIYYYLVSGSYYPVYVTRSGNTWSGYSYTLYYKNDNSYNRITTGNSSTTTISAVLYAEIPVEGTPGYTRIIFNGVAAGVTSVTVGDTKYIIHVVEAAETRELFLYPGDTYTTYIEYGDYVTYPNDAVATLDADYNSTTIAVVGPVSYEQIQNGEQYYLTDGDSNSDGSHNYLTVTVEGGVPKLANTKYHEDAVEWYVKEEDDGFWSIYAVIDGVTYHLNNDDGDLAVSSSASYTFWKYNPKQGFYSANQYISYNETAGAWELHHDYNSAAGAYRYMNSVLDTGYTLTFTGVASGTTTATITLEDGSIIHYTIEVADPEDLEIELWNTNQHVLPIGPYTEDVDWENNSGLAVMKIKANADVISATGAAIADLLPATAMASGGTNYKVFWKAVILDSEHSQTTINGTNQTMAGTEFTMVRYDREYGWQYQTDNGTWAVFDEDSQLVAYYLQETDVTAEILTLISDWGYVLDDNMQAEAWASFWSAYGVFDFQVEYPSGAQSPTSFPAANGTIVYNANQNIGTILAQQNNPAYYVKEIQVITGTATVSTNGGTGTVTRVTYDESTAATVWTEDMGGDPVVTNLNTGTSGTAHLIRFVLGVNPDYGNLHVHYVNMQTGAEFNSFNIAANDDSFEGWVKDGTPTGTWSVTNIVGNSVTVYYKSEDFAKVTNMPSAYVNAGFEFDHAEVSADNTDLYLYYDSEFQEIHYVDFGLKFEIEPQYTGFTLTSARGKYGYITEENGKYYYVPTETMQGADEFELTNQTTGATALLSIIPATNVLYENNFLSLWEKYSDGAADWVEGKSFVGQQETNDTELYGYDEAYKDSIGLSFESAWTISGLSAGGVTKYLTTSFYGNGLDLIGDAGPDTGYVYLLLQGPENKLVIIDTSYVDGNGTTLHQVPLAHLTLTQGVYTMYISAGYRAAVGTDTDATVSTQSVSAARSISTFSMFRAPSATDVIYDMVDRLFGDGFDIDDIEFVYSDVSSALAELATPSVATFAMVNTLSGDDDEDEEEETTVYRPEGTTVVIDAFRVYRASSDIDIESERGVTYVNVLDAVLDGSAGYIESDGTGTYGGDNAFSRADYEGMGGPENEFYLAPNSAVTFNTNASEGQKVQISARAVTGVGTKFTTDTETYDIATNTEMYYEVTVGKGGVLTIANSGSGILGLGNLKFWDMTSTANVTSEPTEETYAAAFSLMRSLALAAEPEAPVEPEVSVFEPAQLDVKVKSTNVILNKLVTVTITASTDVAELTVNGKTLQPTNSLLVKLGLSKTYTYVLVETVKKSDTKTYEIVAYDADGVASETYTVQG